MSLIASMVKFTSKLHPRAKKTWAKFPVPQMCKYVAAWSLNEYKNGNYFDPICREIPLLPDPLLRESTV